MVRLVTSRWTAADLPDLEGTTVVVTGANSGLGLVTARELARVGAHVVLAVRDEERGRTAAATIAGSSEVRRLDLADLGSVRAFADGWTGDLDVLINNAGVMAVPKARTVDGFEMQFGTNHLGHFALTNLLLPSITDRVVTVSSGAHRMGRIVLDDLNWERRRYKAWAAYGQSKLANLLFTLELERRLIAAESPRPGARGPPRLRGDEPPVTYREPDHLGADGASPTRSWPRATPRARCPRCSPPRRTYPEGASSDRTASSRLRGYPELVSPSAAATDPDMAARLWAASEQLTGTTFPTT